MASKQTSYPFQPKSTAQLVPGQFWAVPLPDGRFACGRVLQLDGSEIPMKSRHFFGGLQDWLGESPPTVDAIAHKVILRFGVMHIRSITNTGGMLLGHRTLELDEIQLPMLLSSMGGNASMLLQGANAVRRSLPEEWGKIPTLGFWGWDFIRELAISQLAPTP